MTDNLQILNSVVKIQQISERDQKIDHVIKERKKLKGTFI